MIQLNCIDCERRRAELLGQLNHLTKKIKERATTEHTTFGVYIDQEDQKLGVLTLEECYARGFTPIEIISKYQ